MARDTPAPALFGAGLLVAVVRWWTSHRREVFELTPDEPGQLAIARFVGGLARWDMFDRSTWRPGFGTLIAPIHWLTADPVLAYRAALAVNAVLGGVACVLLCLLAHRLTVLSWRAAVTAALIVALSPAVLFTTTLTWSESLVSVTFLGALLAMLRFDERPTLGRGAAVIALAGVGFAAHSRLLPLTAVAVALVAAEVMRRRLSVRVGFGLAAAAAAAVWGVSAYSTWLVERIWETPQETNTVGGVLARLADPGAIALSVLGQVWYQLVTTLGLVGLGAIVLIGAARRAPAADLAAWPARIVLAATGALVAVSIVFMSDRLRPDQIVYGRYNDAIVGPLVLVGIGALISMRGRALATAYAVLACGTIAAAGALVAWREEALAASGALRTMVLGLLGFTGGATAIDVVAITGLALAALAGLALAVALAHRAERRSWAILVLVALVLVGYVRTRPVVDDQLNAWALPAASVRRLDDALPADEPVRFRMAAPGTADVSWHEQRLRTMLYQFYLPDHPMSVDRAGTGAVGRYVFAPLGDPVLAAAGAEVVWRDPTVSIGLWREPARGIWGQIVPETASICAQIGC